MILQEQREMWIGSVFVVEWDLLDTDGGPVDDATVTGTIALPSGGTATMTIDHTAGTHTYRASYEVGMAGRHGYKVTAAGSSAGVIAGGFVVNRDVTGAPPITTALSDPVGLVRLLITDTDEAFPLFTDADLKALLTLEGNNTKRAAAAALETIATSETLRSKKITTQDLSTDGPAVSKDLRDRAKELRAQVAADAVDPGSPGAAVDPDAYGFDFVDVNTRHGWGGW